MSAIEVKDLKKYFGSTKAVDGVSFSVEKGEIFGFLGPNGAGKTTAIRCILGFLKPTEGYIKLLDKDIKVDGVALRGKLGFLPGNIRLYEDWNGVDHIRFLEGLRGKKGNSENLAKKLNYNPKLKVKHLSTGNRQKLGLILALMFNPEIIILDEPTSGLDPLLQNTIYKILEELNKQGATILMSSHNMPEVERLCSRVAIIRDGKLVTLEKIENLESKRIHAIKVIFEGEFTKADFEMPGVEIVDIITDGLMLNIKGDIGPIIKKISTYKIKDLEITHATLEDIFLEFYHNGEEK